MFVVIHITIIFEVYRVCVSVDFDFAADIIIICSGSTALVIAATAAGLASPGDHNADSGSGAGSQVAFRDGDWMCQVRILLHFRTLESPPTVFTFTH